MGLQSTFEFHGRLAKKMQYRVSIHLRQIQYNTKSFMGYNKRGENAFSIIKPSISNTTIAAGVKGETKKNEKIHMGL